MRIGSTTLYLSHLHADFRTVSVSHSFHDFRARTATARGTVDFAGLSRLLHVTVHYGGHGTIALTKKLPVLGKRTLTFKASYANGALRFGKAAVAGAQHLGQQVTSLLKHYLDVRTPLRRFPFDVRVRSVRVDAGGLEFALAGRNLAYRNS